MILSDREIRFALKRGAIWMDPFPDEIAWSSTTVDFRLDARLQIWKPIEDVGTGDCICPSSPKFNALKLVEKHCTSEDCTNGYQIQPN